MEGLGLVGLGSDTLRQFIAGLCWGDNGNEDQRLFAAVEDAVHAANVSNDHAPRRDGLRLAALLELILAWASENRPRVLAVRMNMRGDALPGIDMPCNDNRLCWLRDDRTDWLPIAFRGLHELCAVEDASGSHCARW